MASILDDYLSTSDPLNEPPSTGIPPVTYNSGGGSAPVALPFHETQTKTPETTVTRVNPKYTETTVKTPESKTTAAQTGGTTNWSETQKVINTDYKPESREDFAKRTGARAVIDQLVMQKPKPTGDPERMRKIAGVQAIGEALRNVVDAVYGARKAKIDPHKSYSDNLLTQAKNMDSTYAGQLKEYFKTLNDAEKKLTDDYLRMLMSEKDAKYKSKTIGGSNRDITTTTTTPEKTVTTIGKVTGGGSVATRTGGTIEKTGVRSGFNNGATTEDNTDKHTFIFQNGSQVTVDKDRFRMLYQNAIAYGASPKYSEVVRDLIKKIQDDNYTPTEDEQAQIIQETGDKNLDLIKPIVDIMERGQNNVSNVVRENRHVDYYTDQTQIPSNQTNNAKTGGVSSYGKPIGGNVKIGNSKANDPFAKFGGSQRK
jgi:hypothetical protein